MSDTSKQSETVATTTEWQPENSPGSVIIIGSNDVRLPLPSEVWFEAERQGEAVDTVLRDNMIEFGFNSAIQVVEIEDFDNPGQSEFVVVAGRRRLKAAVEADKVLARKGKAPLQIPAIVLPSGASGDETSQVMSAISENELRKASSPMTLAMQMQSAIKAAQDEVWPKDAEGNRVPYKEAEKVVSKAKAATIRELMRLLGKSDAFVYNTLALLNLAPPIKVELAKNPSLPVRQLIEGGVTKLGTLIDHTGQFVPDETAQRKAFDKIFPPVKTEEGAKVVDAATNTPSRRALTQEGARNARLYGDGFEPKTSAQLAQLMQHQSLSESVRVLIGWCAGRVPDYFIVRHFPKLEKAVNDFRGPGVFLSVQPDDAEDFVMPETFDPIKRAEEYAKMRQAEKAKKAAEKQKAQEAKEAEKAANLAKEAEKAANLAKEAEVPSLIDASKGKGKSKAAKAAEAAANASRAEGKK